MLQSTRSRFSALLAVSLLALPSAGAAFAADGEWVELTNGAVTVYVPAEPDQLAAARELIDGIEGRRQLLASLFEKPFPPVTPVAIYLFPDGAAGQPFGATPDAARRMRLEHVGIGLAAGPLDPQRQTLVRGAVEMFLEDHMGRVPIFWRAGLVQFLLEVEVSGKAARPIASAELLALLRQGDWLPLGQYTDSEFASQPPEVKQRLAAQQWALIFRDAVVDQKKKERLLTFYRQMLGGQRASVAFPMAYDNDMGSVQTEVKDAVKRNGSNSYSNAAATFPVTLPPVTEKQLSGADLDATLGLLLADLRVPAEAEKRCAAALEKQAGHARGVLCAARVLELRGEIDNARQLYAQASAAAPDDKQIAFFATRAGRMTSPPKPAAPPAAPAAPAAPPAPAPAEVSLLTQANDLMEKKDYPGAVKLLEQARQETTDPAVAESLDTKIAELRKFIEQNAFAKGFTVAAEHYNASRWNEAISTLEALLPTLSDPESKKKTADLLAKAKGNRDAAEQAGLHNQFVAAYNKATELYKEKKLKECATLLDKQLAMKISPEDKKVAQKFLELCRPPGA